MSPTGPCTRFTSQELLQTVVTNTSREINTQGITGWHGTSTYQDLLHESSNTNKPSTKLAKHFWVHGPNPRTFMCRTLLLQNDMQPDTQNHCVVAQLHCCYHELASRSRPAAAKLLTIFTSSPRTVAMAGRCSGMCMQHHKPSFTIRSQ